MNQYKKILEIKVQTPFDDYCYRIDYEDDYRLKYFQMFVNFKEIKNGVYKLEYETDKDIVKDKIAHCYIYFKYPNSTAGDNIEIIYVTTYRNEFNKKSKFEMILS